MPHYSTLGQLWTFGHFVGTEIFILCGNFAERGLEADVWSCADRAFNTYGCPEIQITVAGRKRCVSSTVWERAVTISNVNGAPGTDKEWQRRSARYVVYGYPVLWWRECFFHYSDTTHATANGEHTQRWSHAFVVVFLFFSAIVSTWNRGIMLIYADNWQPL